MSILWAENDGNGWETNHLVENIFYSTHWVGPFKTRKYVNTNTIVNLDPNKVKDKVH